MQEHHKQGGRLDMEMNKLDTCIEEVERLPLYYGVDHRSKIQTSYRTLVAECIRRHGRDRLGLKEMTGYDPHDSDSWEKLKNDVTGALNDPLVWDAMATRRQELAVPEQSGPETTVDSRNTTPGIEVIGAETSGSVAPSFAQGTSEMNDPGTASTLLRLAAAECLGPT